MITAVASPHQAALDYAARGWRVVPIKAGTKFPPLKAWQKDATTDTDIINAWWTGRYRDCGVGVATGPASGIWVLDVDNLDSLAELEAGHDLLDTLASYTGSGGLHLIFRWPDNGQVIRNRQSGELGPGLDIRGDGGQIVVAPTVHPNGEQYRWAGASSEPQPAPAWLLERLAALDHKPAAPAAALPVRQPQRNGIAATRSTDERPGDRWAAATDWADILGPDGWQLGHTDSAGERHWVRPGKEVRDGTSATTGYTGYDTLKVFTSSMAHLGLSADETYSKLGYLAATRHGGDHRAAAQALANDGWGSKADSENAIRSLVSQRAAYRHAQITGGTVIDHQVSSELTPDTGATNLPPSFWTARPELARIRAAAHSRTRSADAVFGVVLARLAAITPPSIQLPDPVGVPGSLNLAVALIGHSGAGKSSSVDTGALVMPVPFIGDDIAIMSLGSGEGLIEAYWGTVDEPDEKGKIHKVRQQVRRSVLFLLDEGQAMGEMGSRKGSTLMPTIRSACTGQRLGQANASEERTRQLRPGEYRFALIAGFQTEVAVELINDSAGGTPQRFIFLAAEDPSIPDDAPAWPGGIEWSPPQHQAGPMGLDAEVAREIRSRALARARGQVIIDPLDAHRDLGRLKVAGLLALLAGRLTVDAEDWALAGLVLDCSDAVRASIIAEAQRRAEHSELVYSAKLATRSAVNESQREGRALVTCARALARHVERNACGGCKRRCLQRSMSGKYRDLITFEEALDEAVNRSWIVVDDDTFSVGESRPA